ncbi:MAG: pilus assembly protein [Rhodobiaceae bacterium]|nr:pilus assembly protein [Rhodobiaceae bacterium]
MTHTLKRFLRARGGNALLVFSLVAPLLVLAVGGAIDFAQLSAQKSKLQMAADEAALASAKELYLDGVTDEQVQSVAEAIASSILAKDGNGAAITSAVSGQDKDTVTVTIEQTADDALLASFGVMKADLRVDAVAHIVGGGRLCLVGLETKEDGAISLTKESKINAPTCSVYSNSKSKDGIKSSDSSELIAEFICSAGGKFGSKGNFTPDPVLDCPIIENPLGSRPKPSIGPCVSNNLEIEDKDVPSKSVTLTPGTYCGGLTIKGDLTVNLKPGIYVIQDGDLVVDGGASFIGANVGFFLTGGKTKFKFKAKSTIDLTAPKDGPMAGMLIWGDTTLKDLDKHTIESNDARNLLGTIYMPNAKLEITAKNPVADQSAYTIIVAQRLELDAGPTLVLNTNYGGTDIPVPKGVGPTGGNIYLTR